MQTQQKVSSFDRLLLVSICPTKRGYLVFLGRVSQRDSSPFLSKHLWIACQADVPFDLYSTGIMSSNVGLGIVIGPALTSILQRAVELDTSKRYTESLVCYEQGLQVLMEVVKNTPEEPKKMHLRQKVEEYMTRAEMIKKLIKDKKALGEYREQVVIEADSTGHSYQSVFGRFLDLEVTSITVEDPYIRNFHQCQNFLRFCELAVSNCSNLKSIDLITNVGHHQQEAQDTNSWLATLKNSLLTRGVSLSVEIRPTLHDRTIRLNNGWIIKIGRGLDYFKSPENKMALGFFNMDLRKCHETTVDIFHKGNVSSARK